MSVPRLSALAASTSPRSITRSQTLLRLADGREVTVQCVRHPQARRIKLSVDERGARLTLPWRASLASGLRFLEDHRDWLATQLASHDTGNLHDAVPPAPGIDGVLPLRGETLPLHWRIGRSRRLLLEEGCLHFQVLASDMAGTAGDPVALRRVLRQFYMAQAHADVGRWLPRYLPGLPRPPLRIAFKQMRSQWGSLTAKGVMALDLSLVLARPSAFEYVLVHELCHLIHHDHSPAYWDEVARRWPAWRTERDYLHAEGRRLKASLHALLSAANTP